MLRKPHHEAMIDIERRYAKEISPEYTIENLFEFAKAHKLWVPAKTEFQIFRQEMRDALKKQVDSEGDRWYVTAKVDDVNLWGLRTEVPWAMRQAFLDEQLRRVTDDKISLERMLAKLNHERAKDEPEFQLRFEW